MWSRLFGRLRANVFGLPPSVRVYVASAAIDLRRGHDGLCAVVRGQFGFDPYTGHLFVFFGRRLDRCKILFWDRGGFVLYYKRFERGRFRIPRRDPTTSHFEIDATELMMLLDGIDVTTVHRLKMWQPPSRKSA